MFLMARLGLLPKGARSCRGQGRAPQARRETSAIPVRAVGSRELCQPRTEADRKPVTESNLSLRAPAQRAAAMRGWSLWLSIPSHRQNWLICTFRYCSVL